MQISAGLAYLDQTAPFRAGGVSEVTCRMSKTYLLAAALVCKNQLAQVYGGREGSPTSCFHSHIKLPVSNFSLPNFKFI